MRLKYVYSESDKELWEKNNYLLHFFCPKVKWAIFFSTGCLSFSTRGVKLPSMMEQNFLVTIMPKYVKQL